MELRELRYFLTVAETGSFSRASAKLGITQPTLSRQIQSLESEIKTLLFYRDGRGVQLTDAGKRLMEVSAPLLRQLDEVHDEILHSGKEPTGEVRIGVPPSIGSTIAAPLIAKFQKAAPHAHLHLLEGFSGRLLEWVEQGAIDVAVLYDARRLPNMLVTPILLEDLFIIDAANGSTEQGAVSLEELRGQHFMLPGKKNGLRRVIDAAFDAAGIAITVSTEVDSVAVLKQLAMMKAARTILPFGAVHHEVFDGRLIAIPFSSSLMRAKLVIATTMNKPISRATRLLIDLLKQEFSNCLERGILRGTIPQAV